MSWLEQKIEPTCSREIGKPVAPSTAYHGDLLRDLEQKFGEKSVIETCRENELLAVDGLHLDVETMRF